MTIYTDGASRGNPGESASGYQVFDETGKMLQKGEVYNGIKTNNYAEYNAIINALKWCIANLDASTIEIELHSDSRLVISQINGLFKIKSEDMLKLNKEVKELIKKFKSTKFINERREVEGISNVDRAINLFLDKRERENTK